jgi:hypothetical protein
MTWTRELAWKSTVRYISAGTVLLALAAGPVGKAQTAPVQPPRRVHLILRDGSFQLVLDYRVVGKNVVYHSAERGGTEEVIPLALVDLDATHTWEKRHTVTADGQPAGPPEIDPELLKEESARAALTPEIAPDLHLPEQDSVLALDTFHSVPDLVPLAQSDGQLNRNTAHNVLLGMVNPLSSSHAIVTLRGMRAAVQVHVPDPVFYVRIGDEADTPASGSALTVDTRGATGNAASASAGGSAGSRYVIVRTDVRTDSRVLASFSLTSPGDGRPLPEDVTEVKAEPLPGGHWLKLTPVRQLDFGEFALMEILDARRINLGVWDFGIHPAAPENRDAMKPEPKRRPTLDRHHDDDLQPVR